MKKCEICNKIIIQKWGSPKVCSEKCKQEKERLRSRRRYYTESGYKEKMFERCYKYARSQKGKDYIWEWYRRKKGTWNTSCEICGEKRFVERCHIIRKRETKDNFLCLCPTHHIILDNWLNKSRGNQFTKKEYNKIKYKIEKLIIPRKI